MTETEEIKKVSDMVNMKKRIVIENNQFNIEGVWTIEEVLNALEAVKVAILRQRISIEKRT